MDNIQHIILDDTLSRVVEPQFSGYICHAYCHGGSCTFTRNGNEHRMEAGDCLIIPRRGDLVENLQESGDFRVSVIYVTQEFIEVSTPQSNYGIRGHLSLFHNPIMRLTPEMQQRCAANFEVIRLRLSQPQHNFYHEVLANAVQAMILDFFDFHAVLYGADKITSQYRQIMEQFLNMLDQGDYRTNREIGYYADKLCIT
ncbi:MAG: AraC family transcriptional regulator, partial [Prevotella sp.]|nr:AraC family transcriptional regulator [Prevotella sp.]